MANQSRKWLITLNNPVDYGFTFEYVNGVVGSLKNIDYWCYGEEVGENGTHHFHLFIYKKSPIAFDTLKNRFPQAHLDIARGTCSDNRDYVFKQGKWEKDKKAETSIPNTQFESGEMPIERQGARNDLADLYDLIVGGASDVDIISENPNFMLHIDKFDKIRQSYREKLYSEQFRQLDVTYISGQAGTGKTRFVMDKYGYSNVYRVTDYVHPFDYYAGQDVILFDEFRSSIKIVDMLNYLDGYPLMLPCRYNNKVACYTKVYIISNISLQKQYSKVQIEEPATFQALLRRIHHNCEMSPFGLLAAEPPEQISLNISPIPTIRKTCLLRIVGIDFMAALLLDFTNHYRFQQI